MLYLFHLQSAIVVTVTFKQRANANTTVYLCFSAPRIEGNDKSDVVGDDRQSSLGHCYPSRESR